MDTTRENVERWIGVLQSQQFDQTPELAPILSALTAERDTLKALCVEMLQVINAAAQVGEIRFKTCVLSAQVHDQIAAVQGRARSMGEGNG